MILSVYFILPIVRLLGELSEHYPMMWCKSDVQVFYSRNRYAGFTERLFIGMHGDHFHLTHHLLPGVPHWNLAAATKILREDKAFRMWDDYWGGIFSSNRNDRISLIRFIRHEWQSLPVLPSNH
ncbi:fatty acid desaturase [Aquitalea denitrificans]|uniref:fatty acid desaturase n=1 Tax=Aquitalea denitrificans TaxID=519081 RepID=UPI00135BA933|nr:fatty acid desaturase [Aquitalea denitrificans]